MLVPLSSGVRRRMELITGSLSADTSASPAAPSPYGFSVPYAGWAYYK